MPRKGQFIDITGQRFGQLVVLSLYGQKSDGTALWTCNCNCGATGKYSGTRLRKGKTTRCFTCVHGNHYTRLDPGVAAAHMLFRTYQRKAKERGLTWDLTEEYFSEMTKKPCHYCGIFPHQEFFYSPGGKYRDGGSCLYNGLDRVANDAGYLKANVVPCCGPCNNMKRVMPQSAFVEQALRIADHQRRAHYAG